MYCLKQVIDHADANMIEETQKRKTLSKSFGDLTSQERKLKKENETKEKKIRNQKTRKGHWDEFHTLACRIRSILLLIDKQSSSTTNIFKHIAITVFKVLVPVTTSSNLTAFCGLVFLFKHSLKVKSLVEMRERERERERERGWWSWWERGTEREWSWMNSGKKKINVRSNKCYF